MSAMTARRLTVLALVALLMYGAFGYIGGYAAYLRGDGYREACAAALTDHLELPSDIGAVVPRSRHWREFRDIAVWLPQRRGRALTCEQALVMLEPTADDPNAYEIQVRGGTCEISTRTWLREDYRGVLEAGLRTGFQPDGPRRVTFEKMNLHFERDRFRAQLDQAAGLVDFIDPRCGRAAISCWKFNGYDCEQAVRLGAVFCAFDGRVRIDQLELVVPEIPIRAADLKSLAGVDVQSGDFAGRLTYEETEDGRLTVVSGKCRALDLSECTVDLTPQPWRGECREIELQELRVVDRSPERLRFRGVLTGVELGDILATWGLEGVRGAVNLVVGDADLSHRGIDRFIASGGGKGIELESLSRGLGWGVMTGDLTLIISDLTIEDNHIKSLDAELRVADAEGTPNWIEGRLLQTLIERTLKVALPPLLPERIEYVKLGVKIEIRDEILYVFGTHGPRESVILTARLYEQDVPIVIEPRRSFDLGPWLDDLRRRASDRIEMNLPVHPRTP